MMRGTLGAMRRLASRQQRVISRPMPPFARGFADAPSAASNKKPQAPPIQLYGLEGTYATALFEAASVDSTIARTEKSVTSLKQLMDSNETVKSFVLDPSLSPTQQKDVIDVVTETIGGDKVFRGFLEVLAENNRLTILPEVIEEFGKLANAANGLVEATVTSVKALDNATMKRLQSAISSSKLVGSGKTLKLENIVDPSIRGGLIVSVGDRTVDVSVSGQLQKYNSLLNESI